MANPDNHAVIPVFEQTCENSRRTVSIAMTTFNMYVLVNGGLLAGAISLIHDNDNGAQTSKLVNIIAVAGILVVRFLINISID